MVITHRGIGGYLRFVVAVAAVAVLGATAGSVGAAESCDGDCDLNGRVAVNELVLGVNLSLEAGDVAMCAAMDRDSSVSIEVNELVGAVNRSLEGCPAIECVAPAGGRCVPISPGPEAQDQLLTALLEARPHDVIFLKQGRYDIDRELSLSVDDVTIQGEGYNRSILSFDNQTAGAQGLLVRADRFLLQDIGLEDSPGDLVKVTGADGVTFRGVRTEWTGEPSTDNGAYGLYPVECRNVLVEDSVVKGASDAGIYVGQSRNIVVRRNRVEFNVAGIEIENSTDADVYDNVATNNTGGVLVFNLPGPPVQDGRRTRLFDNQIYENNHPNFGAPGSTVAIVPPGTGVIVLSNDEVEIFDNDFRDNDTTHIFLLSYTTAVVFGAPASTNPDFDPYSESVFVYDNTFVGGGTNPPPSLQVLVNLNEGLPLPNIIFDGEADPDKEVGGQLPAPLRTCVQQSEPTFLNLDLANGGANVSKDLATVDCTLELLSPIMLDGGRQIEIEPGPDAADQIRAALLEARPGDDIRLAAGTYDFTAPLSLTVDHVTLRGAGMDETILRFAGLSTGQGGQALRVTGDDFTLADLALEDVPGVDLFRAQGVDGLRIQRARAEWTNRPPTMANGAYGFYPVDCKDVLIEDSVAIGASDTGIYVGQSRNIIVRRNRVELNVAGIEIENSTAVDVYENTATNNAGGILVFNLPGLQVYGERTRVYNNQSFANNTPNFAPPGNIVAGVPSGTGLMVLANDKVEVFGNSFRDNNTSQITLISYITAAALGGLEVPDLPDFDPFSESIYIHDNTYVGGGEMVDPDFALLLDLIGRDTVPQIVYDGDEDPEKLEDGALPPELRTCIQESQEPAVTFVDLDVAGGFQNVSFDLAPLDCALERLKPVTIPGA